MSDEFEMIFPRTSLQDAVKGDRREQLEAIRDYIAHELEANLCSTCLNSRLRTGDQASLILRLQTVLAELDALPNSKGEVSSLDSIRLRVVGGTTGSTPATSADPTAQRRTGSRRSR